MRRQKVAVLAMVLAAGLSLSACKGGSQEAAAGSEATKEVEQKAEKELSRLCSGVRAGA